jgi:phenylacetate-coenzyme A ligase PaaK-like adenylate-forming protein
VMRGAPMPAIPAGPTAVVASGSLRHGMTAGAAGAASVGSDLPEHLMLKHLQDTQPSTLVVLPWRLTQICQAQLEGRLSIAPAVIVSGGEPVSEVLSTLVRDAFPNALSSNVYGCTELGSPASGPLGGPLTINEDLLYFEALDADGAPVEPGQPSHIVAGTQLFDAPLPLFRYALNDSVTLDETPLTGLRQIIEINGRADDHFRYGPINIDPGLFRAPLTRPDIHGFQVHQTANGADIKVIGPKPIDVETLLTEITARLEKTGLTDPSVVVTQVDSLRHQPDGGKVKRFISIERD